MLFTKKKCGGGDKDYWRNGRFQDCVVKKASPVSLDSLVAILRVRNYSTPEDDVSQGRNWLGSISI